MLKNQKMKTQKSSGLKKNAEHLLDSAKENVTGITKEAKTSAKILGKKVQSKSRAIKKEAIALFKSI